MLIIFIWILWTLFLEKEKNLFLEKNGFKNLKIN